MTSQSDAAFHRSQHAYHERRANEHRDRSEEEVEQRYRAAAEAHRQGALMPLDKVTSNKAMRASGTADEASQRTMKR